MGKGKGQTDRRESLHLIQLRTGELHMKLSCEKRADKKKEGKQKHLRWSSPMCYSYGSTHEAIGWDDRGGVRIW